MKPEDFNRFAYVRNRPLALIDPTGHECYETTSGTIECDEGNVDPTGRQIVEPAYNVFRDRDLRAAQKRRLEAQLGHSLAVANPGVGSQWPTLTPCDMCGNSPLGGVGFTRTHQANDPAYVSKSDEADTSSHEQILAIGQSIRPHAGDPSQFVSISIHQGGPGGHLYGVIADQQGAWIGRIQPVLNDQLDAAYPGNVFELSGLTDSGLEYRLPDELRGYQGPISPGAAIHIFGIPFETLFYVGDF